MNTVSFVFQNSRLLKASILENVRLSGALGHPGGGSPCPDLAQCRDILDKLPKGMDTVIGAGGTYLSGGEQQRIAIARVILQDAPIVLMDEATAFADPDNESKVQAAFANLAQGRRW